MGGVNKSKVCEETMDLICFHSLVRFRYQKLLGYAFKV